MHIGNRDFLEYLRERFPRHFNSASVLELGSLDVNGSARDHFIDCDYVGIDITPGPGVDFLVPAAKTSFVKMRKRFDTVLCMSMAEHDPNWRESIAHNMQWLKKGGLFVMSWGAEGNLHHLPEPWAPVPSQDMKEFLTTLPLRKLNVFPEGSRFTADCVGCWDAYAFKTMEARPLDE